MKVSKRLFVVVFVAIAVANLAGFAAFMQRQPLTPEEWVFLENQRPRRSEHGLEINIVHDGLNFALARRQVGGWESVLVKALMAFNLPAYAASSVAFDALQATPGGTSRRHSDFATGVFLTACLGEWLAIALFASVRRGAAVPAHSDPRRAA